jgi:hypothetical protein
MLQVLKLGSGKVTGPLIASRQDHTRAAVRVVSTPAPFSWFSSLCPDKCWDSASNYAMIFPVYYSQSTNTIQPESLTRIVKCHIVLIESYLKFPLHTHLFHKEGVRCIFRSTVPRLTDCISAIPKVN